MYGRGGSIGSERIMEFRGGSPRDVSRIYRIPYHHIVRACASGGLRDQTGWGTGKPLDAAALAGRLRVVASTSVLAAAAATCSTATANNQRWA
jgi:hypothetical protein